MYSQNCLICNSAFNSKRKRKYCKLPGCLGSKATKRTLLVMCSTCGKECFKNKHDIKVSKSGKNFCSLICSNVNHFKERVSLPCGTCGKQCVKTQKELKHSKSGKLFCNRSCSITFHNKNKKTGTRISKLEKYISENIVNFYSFEFHFNRKDTIGSELDIYIPSLRLAIELNGIFHYKPIYGVKKFEQIQLNDKNKIDSCKEKQISLHIIDISSINKFTIKEGRKYLFIIKEIIDSFSKDKESIQK